MKEATPTVPAAPSPFAGSDWFDPLEEAVRGQVRSFIEALLEEERWPGTAEAPDSGRIDCSATLSTTEPFLAVGLLEVAARCEDRSLFSDLSSTFVSPRLGPRRGTIETIREGGPLGARSRFHDWCVGGWRGQPFWSCAHTGSWK